MFGHERGLGRIFRRGRSNDNVAPRCLGIDIGPKSTLNTIFDKRKCKPWFRMVFHTLQMYGDELLITGVDIIQKREINICKTSLSCRADRSLIEFKTEDGFHCKRKMLVFCRYSADLE